MQYTQLDGGRDLRIDFMRGAVMVVLVVVHIEIFSIFNFIAWERVGLISGAEGFVILSGVVLGIVHRKILDKADYHVSMMKLFDRSAQLYRVNLTVIAVVYFLSMLSIVDLSVIKTFINWGNKEVYNLYPNEGAAWHQTLTQFLLLRNGPHQIQILGLYFILLAFTPLAMWFFKNGRPLWLLYISWVLYFYNMQHPSRPTMGQFEYGFPVLSWQVIFFNGLAVGYYKDEIRHYFSGNKYHALVSVALVFTLVFAFIAWNSPNKAFPEWANFGLIEAKAYHDMHWQFFDKNKLGILRIVNYFCFLVVFYRALTLFWKPLNRLIGWLLVPLGQASLYVFIVHLGFIVLVEYISKFSEMQPVFDTSNFIENSIIHTVCILGLWLLVRYKVLFSVIPR
ncbi:hypothetical protein A9Q99_00360 [Gammaproteobacteria bacterium 45_16_T64]|nr:hypothetical protein A9Q99_00360 [Gammaproteobacteria bacterium 45_16_T64]